MPWPKQIAWPSPNELSPPGGQGQALDEGLLPAQSESGGASLH